MADFNEILIEMAKYQNLMSMSQAERKRLNEYIDKKQATDNQTAWVDLMKAMPVFNSLPVDEKSKAYKAFQNTFYDIVEDKKTYKNEKDVQKFLSKFYGDGLAVEKFTANANFVSLIETNKSDLLAYLSESKVRNYVVHNDRKIEDVSDYNKLVKAIESGKYKSNKNDLIKLQSLYSTLKYDPVELAKKGVPPFNVFFDPSSVAEFEAKRLDLARVLEQPEIKQFLKDEYGVEPAEINEYIRKLNSGSYTTGDVVELRQIFAILEVRRSDLGVPYSTILPIDKFIDEDIANKVDEVFEKATEPAEITPAQMRNFAKNFPDIIKSIISKDKVFDAFSAHNSAETLAINEAKRDTNYKDTSSDDYLLPKYDDRKRRLDRAKDKIKKWEKDRFGKWRSRHERHKYSTNARNIVGSIIDNKISPVDGLGKILENKDKINEKLPPKSKDDFKYMTKVLGKLSKTKAFSEATKDGDQMRYIVQEIILDAVQNDKINECKATLESLAMITYGATTSSVRDNFRKANEETALFSDPAMSFNNNDFTKSVTGALDKTIKFGLNAGFEVANFIKNKAVRQRGLKFKNGTKRLHKLIKDSALYKDDDKKKKMEELFAFWDFVNSNITKDFNLFKKHSKVQENWDKDSSIAGQTNAQRIFRAYKMTHNIGRE